MNENKINELDKKLLNNQIIQEIAKMDEIDVTTLINSFKLSGCSIKLDKKSKKTSFIVKLNDRRKGPDSSSKIH